MATIDPPITRATAVASPTSKPIFKSKTALINVIIMLATALSNDAVAKWVSAHPNETVIGFTVLGIILRKVSHGRITLLASDD